MQHYVIGSLASGKIEVKDLDHNVLGHMPSDWVFSVGKVFEYYNQNQENEVSFKLYNKSILKHEYSILSNQDLIGKIEANYSDYNVELFDIVKIIVNINNPTFSFLPKLECTENNCVEVEHSGYEMKIKIMETEYESWLLGIFSLILKHELNKK